MRAKSGVKKTVLGVSFGRHLREWASQGVDTVCNRRSIGSSDDRRGVQDPTL